MPKPIDTQMHEFLIEKEEQRCLALERKE